MDFFLLFFFHLTQNVSEEDDEAFSDEDDEAYSDEDDEAYSDEDEEAYSEEDEEAYSEEEDDYFGNFFLNISNLSVNVVKLFIIPIC